jgi:XTP/dITP diphosphohydrolase
MEYIFATHNPGKMREIRAICEEYGLTALSLGDAGLAQVVEEDGDTFAENAFIKARGYAELLSISYPDAAILADDSGLVIDALDGRPGVYSARFLGEDTPYAEKSNTLLEMLRDVPDERRTARFVCAFAAILPGGRSLSAEGVAEGVIANRARGENGFGYDPIFLLPEYGLTMAELPAQQKNDISHRGRALRELLDMLTGTAA